MRFATAICLALYIAFWLELDNPSWAGTSAGIVCQPILGATLRKGAFRAVGTVVGAAYSVLLTACFPQDRIGYLAGLALWGGVCTFATTILRNFSAYGAALAGYTAAIIFSDSVNAPGDVLEIAIARAAEIIIGIACGTLVTALTDLGKTRATLAASIERISGVLGSNLLATLREIERPDGRPSIRREEHRDLAHQLAALDPMIDQAAGEALDLRRHIPMLHAAVNGLLGALSAWRDIALQAHQDDAATREGARQVLDALDPDLTRFSPQRARGWPSREEIARWHMAAARSIRRLVALPLQTPAATLLADRTADGLIGLDRALEGLILLVDPAHTPRRQRLPTSFAPDLAAPLVNAFRAIAVIALASLIWIFTEWPSGPTFIAFAAVIVILLSPRDEQAYSGAVAFGVGTIMAAVLAAVAQFALMPFAHTFLSFALVLFLFLLPLGTWSAGLNAVAIAAAMNFLPLLSPSNQISYDPGSFYNAALAIVGGCLFAAAGLRIIPPVPPRVRTQRMVVRTLRELRAIAARRRLPPLPAWQDRMYARLAVLPDDATRLQRLQLLAGLGAGGELIRLRFMARRLGLRPELRRGLDALARGDLASADAGFAAFDRAIAALGLDHPRRRTRLRARAMVAALRSSMAERAEFFGARLR